MVNNALQGTKLHSLRIAHERSVLHLKQQWSHIIVPDKHKVITTTCVEDFYQKTVFPMPAKSIWGIIGGIS